MLFQQCACTAVPQRVAAGCSTAHGTPFTACDGLWLSRLSCPCPGVLLLLPADDDMLMPALWGGVDGAGVTCDLLSAGFSSAMLLISGEYETGLGAGGGGGKGRVYASCQDLYC